MAGSRIRIFSDKYISTKLLVQIRKKICTYRYDWRKKKTHIQATLNSAG